ncbi:MAG: hypothetical protein K2X28_05650 [Alphaproteobacteria bacterium]|nr:hypothetical protein [Alphaproteobacteria bacterium]
MSKKSNTMRLVRTLMLGTTVIFPLEKVWGMVDEGPSSRDSGSSSSSYSTVKSTKVLVGDTIVNSTLISSASAVLDALNKESNVKGNSAKRNKAKRNKAFPPSSLQNDLKKLKEENIGRIMYQQALLNPEISQLELIKISLKAIEGAQDDPYVEVFLQNSKKFQIPSGEIFKKTEEQLVKFLNEARDDKKLSFDQNFPKLTARFPNLLNSFLARCPQTKPEKEGEKQFASLFEQYFNLTPPSSKPAMPSRKGRAKGGVTVAQQRAAKEEELYKQHYEQQTKLSVQSWSRLLQIEENLEVTPPPPFASSLSTSSDPFPPPPSSLLLDVEVKGDSLAPSIASTSHGSLEANPYTEYWRGFLPKMGDSFREYNKSSLSDDEIMKVLFPLVPSGQFPDLETARQKFSLLAQGNRPYAQLFNPPSTSEAGEFELSSAMSSPTDDPSLPSPYTEYWKEFLPKMGDSFREYNKSSLSDDEIMKVLFPLVPSGQFPDLETARQKFSLLAQANRPYAQLFNPSEEEN